MKKALLFIASLCCTATGYSEIFFDGFVSKVGNNYYCEFWDDEDESDYVRVCVEWWGDAPDTLFVPATIEWFGKTAYVDMVDAGFFSDDNLRAVVVDEANRSLSSHGGVLFSKDGTELIGWPKGKQGTFTIGKDMKLNYSNLKNRPGLAAIEVDEADTLFSSSDGVLFSKDGTRLLVCPAGRQGSYSVPQGVTAIDCSAFSGCSQLTDIQLPVTVMQMGYGAFEWCTQLQSVNIPDGVEILESDLFSHCERLEMLDIPQSVCSLGYHVFTSCNSLKTITLPAALTKMEYNSLWYDYGTTDVFVDEANPVYKSIDGILYSKDGRKLLHCPCGRTGTVGVEEGVTTLDHTFFCCEKLEKVLIPASVEEVGEATFSNCFSLRSIYSWREEPAKGKVYVFWPSENNFWLPSQCTVYVPQGSKVKYQQSDEDNWWSNFWIEEFDITGIDEGTAKVNVGTVESYGIDGRPAKGRKGVRIERRSDGTVRKTLRPAQ